MFRQLVYLLCVLFLFSCSGGTNGGEPILLVSDSLSVEAVEDITSGRYEGRVVKVCDGDTYDLLIDGELAPRRVRMAAIDAPEHGQDFSRRSRRYLDSLIGRREVAIEVVGKDSYGRILALTYTSDGLEMSHEMVRSGMAWHYKHYDKDAAYDSLENQARMARLGLWADDCPVEPWVEKAMRKKGYKSAEIKSMKRQGIHN